MTYRGTVKNGVVVIEGGKRPREGARVRIQEEAAPKGKVSARSRRELLRVAGTWAGPASEPAKLLEELRAIKRAEVSAERARLQRGDRTPHNGK